MMRSIHHPGIADNSGSLLQSSIGPEQPALSPIFNICQALAKENITYCHWKSNNALDRSASGDNDLDLLVSRADEPRFTEVLSRLGFKHVTAPAEKDMPGVLNYYGYDEEADKLIHVHAHYQLIVGHDMTKNYRLPIERLYLESAVQQELFKVPAPEFEFIVFVIRMILKHSTWDVILGREGRLKSAERQELAYLQARVDPARVHDILRQHLPTIDVALFNSCAQALQPGCSIWTRMKTGRQLQARLQTNARLPGLKDSYLKLWRRVVLAVRRRVFKSPSKYCLGSGGAMIAIVGGDGAGKSTAVDALYAWLSKDFQTTKVHMGKPAWSRVTIAVRLILKIGQILGFYPLETTFRETIYQKSRVSPGYPWLLREVCRARDRYQIYVKARRFANKGGLVILDRFPVPQIQIMDGPLTQQFISQLTAGPRADQFMSPRRDGRLAQLLVKQEESYYLHMAPPELLIVIRVDPEIAVQRKTDEDAAAVRARSTEMWELNWEHTSAHIVDGSKSKTEVLAELKALIWSEL